MEKNGKNRGGRPRVGDKKDRVISVKCSLRDKTTIQGKARTLRATASEFLRKLGMDGKIDRSNTNLPFEANKIISLLNNIANNINQITKKLNSTGQMTYYLKEQLDFHSAELRKIELLINSYFQ